MVHSTLCFLVLRDSLRLVVLFCDSFLLAGTFLEGFVVHCVILWCIVVLFSSTSCVLVNLNFFLFLVLYRHFMVVCGWYFYGTVCCGIVVNGYFVVLSVTLHFVLYFATHFVCFVVVCCDLGHFVVLSVVLNDTLW